MLNAYDHGGRRTGAAVGTVVYLQDGCRPLGQRNPFAPVVCRDPWIVEAHAPREIAAAARGRDGHWTEARYCARGGNLVHVRSLRTGRRTTVAHWIIAQSLELTS